MFRWLTLAAVVMTIGISTYYRRRARRLGGTIERRREGWQLMLLRAGVALPLFASILAYLASPDSMAWAAVPLPPGLRWAGAALAILSAPSAWWVFRSIGSNVSETVLTKEVHTLITNGPYGWIRHPLYATGAMLFVGTGLMAANAVILVLAALAVVLTFVVAVPKEERALVDRFGEEYRDYMRRTGRLFPRLRKRTG